MNGIEFGMKMQNIKKALDAKIIDKAKAFELMNDIVDAYGKEYEKLQIGTTSIRKHDPAR